MISKITKIITAVIISLGILIPLSTPVFAAEDICSNGNVSDEVKAAAGCPGTSIVSAETVVTNILYAIILVLGIVAVIFIIKGGIDYMTSAGDSGKLQKAKSTIIYAVIGLVICALSFAIVNFTIGIINKGTSGGGEQQNNSQTQDA